MIEVVVIGHNEGQYVDRMIMSLPSEWRIHYIADRCTDDTVERIRKYDDRKIDYIDTLPMNMQGRQTSYCRNLGLGLCGQFSHVIFLDGDRYLTSGDIRALKDSESDIVCLSLEEDPRNKDMFKDNYGCVYTNFYSCGLFIKRKAINKIVKHQGCLFRPDMQEEWGIEDTTLGDVCYALKLKAELSEDIRLHGRFGKTRLDTLDALEKRLRFRSKLGYYGGDNYLRDDFKINWEEIKYENTISGY